MLFLFPVLLHLLFTSSDLKFRLVCLHFDFFGKLFFVKA